MNMIVCVKQIQDPEIPPAKFKIDPAANKVIPPEGVPPVINPFDEQAVEAALRIKDAQGGKITVITAGRESARDVLRHALAMGADEAVILEDETLEGSDSPTIAFALSKAIEKIGQYDLILCGRQSADWDEGQTGFFIAENLGIPIVSLARKLEVVDGKVRVERVLLDGYEIVETPVPAVVTISNELGQPRLPTGFGIITAARKKIEAWTAQDIGIEPWQVGTMANRTKLINLFIPVRHIKCEIIEGEDTSEAATNLALKLREAKLI